MPPELFPDFASSSSNELPMLNYKTDSFHSLQFLSQNPNLFSL